MVCQSRIARNPHHEGTEPRLLPRPDGQALDERWNKGALFLSFLRFDQTRPACVKEPSPTEKVLDYPEWADGYFRGVVKGDLIFSDAMTVRMAKCISRSTIARPRKRCSRTIPTWYRWDVEPRSRPRPSPFNDDSRPHRER